MYAFLKYALTVIFFAVIMGSSFLLVQLKNTKIKYSTFQANEPEQMRYISNTTSQPQLFPKEESASPSIRFNPTKKPPTSQNTLPLSSALNQQTPSLKTFSINSFVSLECYFSSTSNATRGSGVIISQDGIILTNRHVATYVDANLVDWNEKYKTDYCDVGISEEFNRPSENIYRASLLWASNERDPSFPEKITFNSDFAFLKIDKLLISKADCIKKYPLSQTLCKKYSETLPTSFPSIPIGIASNARINDNITIIGFPSEFSEDNKLFQIAGPIKELYLDIIEARVPVEKGYSGSAVLNKYNELIGLLVAGISGDVADFIRIDWIQAHNPLWK